MSVEYSPMVDEDRAEASHSETVLLIMHDFEGTDLQQEIEVENFTGEAVVKALNKMEFKEGFTTGDFKLLFWKVSRQEVKTGAFVASAPLEVYKGRVDEMLVTGIVVSE